MTFKRIIIFCLIIFIPFGALGCTVNKKEIQHLFLVVAVGIDSTSDDRVEVTMQLLNPNVSSVQSGGTSSGSGDKEIIILSGMGDTLLDAVLEASKTMSQTQHFGHTKYIVIGESLARKGIGPLLDSFIRIEEFRLNTPLLVTKGKASEIVRTVTPRNPIPAIVVENLFMRQQRIGFRPFSYIIDYENALSSSSTSPVTAVINIAKPTEHKPNAVFDMSGTAVFDKDKLIGYLNDKETRGLQWTRGKVEAGNVTFTSDKYGKVSCVIVKSKSKIKPTISGEKMTIDIHVKVISDLRRVTKNIDPTKEPEILEDIAKEQSRAVKNEIQLALNTAKDNYGKDIFGFGEAVHKSDPKLWKKIEKDWDSLYQNLEVKIDVESNIRNTGLSSKSIK